VADGEFRRTFFHIDFLQRLQGVAITGGIATKFHTRTGEIDFAPPRVLVTGKLRQVDDIQRADFEFLKSVTIRTPKVTIPSPTMVHFRGGRKAIDIQAYPDLDEFFEDLAQCYRDEVNALYAAGCRYIQLDDTNLAYLCDPQLRAQAQERGDDPNQLPHAYAALINAVIDGRPKDLTVAIHLCRGNRIDEAARYVPLDNLCLSPQCGFASTVQGNEVSEADQWAKLELVVNTARDVWGEVV
jgi:5-methyltetrahydropteroyltriglutamate--homocysteine methyltransferase